MIDSRADLVLAFGERSIDRDILMDAISFFRRKKTISAEQHPRPHHDLDCAYKGMHALHASTHLGIVKEMAEVRDKEKLKKQLLEIACGSGCNIGNFIESEFDYFGFDISEPAIQLAMLKHPRGRYLNLAGDDLSLLSDGCFDIVYCSSLLEHVEGHREYLTQMIRLARRHLYVMFYEGLPNEETKREFHSEPHEAHPMFGAKFMDYIIKSGWYMNRYSGSDILTISQQSCIAGAEILDRTNRPYFSGIDSVLHIWK
jgi:SAM-dependent methyltransferase